MTNRLTYENVKQTLLDLAAERPGYVYQTPQDVYACVYTSPDGKPSCIVGHVLDRLAPDVLPAITDATYYYESGAERATANVFDAAEAMCYVDERPDTDAKYLLVEVQRLQDLRHPWGEAVERAIRMEQGQARGATIPVAAELIEAMILDALSGTESNAPA
jgi:hypothetical protein